jgi:hypothetical protein
LKSCGSLSIREDFHCHVIRHLLQRHHLVFSCSAVYLGFQLSFEVGITILAVGTLVAGAVPAAVFALLVLFQLVIHTVELDPIESFGGEAVQGEPLPVSLGQGSEVAVKEILEFFRFLLPNSNGFTESFQRRSPKTPRLWVS